MRSIFTVIQDYQVIEWINLRALMSNNKNYKENNLIYFCFKYPTFESFDKNSPIGIEESGWKSLCAKKGCIVNHYKQYMSIKYEDNTHKRDYQQFITIDSINMFLSNFKNKIMSYSDYLQTDHWKGLSETCKERDGYRCKLCNNTEQLHAHHRTYINRGDYENELNDLITLCKECHSKYHDK